MGQSPKTVPQTYPINTPTPTGGYTVAATATSGAVSNSAIVNAAMKYNGKHNYHYGGPPPIGTVDCSSWVSEVLGKDLGMNIPGGAWAKVTASGTQHGPDTLSYIAWSGATTVGHSASDAKPGDLVVWQTHMGICIGANQMISAQDEALGTGTANIHMAGEVLFVRRIH